MTPYLDDGDVRLYLGDAIDVLRELPDESVHMAVTSPPFFGLRDYGTGTALPAIPAHGRSSMNPQPNPHDKAQLELEERRAGKILLDLIDTRAREIMLDLFLREVAPVLEDKTMRRIAREELASVMDAALADPQVHEHAKSLAGYVLQRLPDE